MVDAAPSPFLAPSPTAETYEPSGINPGLANLAFVLSTTKPSAPSPHCAQALPHLASILVPVGPRLLRHIAATPLCCTSYSRSPCCPHRAPAALSRLLLRCPLALLLVRATCSEPRTPCRVTSFVMPAAACFPFAPVPWAASVPLPLRSPPR